MTIDRSPEDVATLWRRYAQDAPGDDELFAFKQILETGDIVLSDAWVNGASSRHPAQPDAQASQAATAHSRTDTSEIGGSAA